MKKILVLIGMLAMISVSSFANQSCPVRDSPNNNVAALTYSDKSCAVNGEIIIPITLSKKSEGETVIFVEVRDSNGDFIGTARLCVRDGNTSNVGQSGHYLDHTYENYNLKKGEWYSFSISKASCIAGW